MHDATYWFNGGWPVEFHYFIKPGNKIYPFGDTVLSKSKVLQALGVTKPEDIYYTSNLISTYVEIDQHNMFNKIREKLLALCEARSKLLNSEPLSRAFWNDGIPSSKADYQYVEINNQINKLSMTLSTRAFVQTTGEHIAFVLFPQHVPSIIFLWCLTYALRKQFAIDDQYIYSDYKKERETLEDLFLNDVRVYKDLKGWSLTTDGEQIWRSPVYIKTRILDRTPPDKMGIGYIGKKHNLNICLEALNKCTEESK